MSQHLPAAQADGRVIVAHLGNGASMCALRNGKSVTIADSLRGRPVAEQMLARVAKATGYPR